MCLDNVRAPGPRAERGGGSEWRGSQGALPHRVIKSLEENGIPIDYISGTSIGAVIGGLYAAGYTPQTIKEEFRSVKIQELLNGRIERDNQYYFKQMHRNAAMVTVRLDLKNKGRKARIPANIIPTEPLDMMMSEYFSGATAASAGDFDRLMVPFRCVATDAVGRRDVVFRGGDLGYAVRASIAVPLVFSPVRDTTTLYFDGGMFDNFPWQPLYDDFLPDILIGSLCTETTIDPEEMNSIDQVFAVTTLHTDYSLPREEDILIRRDMSSVNTMDFARAVAFIDAGYEDAMKAMPVIKASIRRRVPQAEVENKRAVFRSREPETTIGSITVEGLKEGQKEYVLNTLGYGTRKQKRDYDFDDLKKGYYKLIAEREIVGQYPHIEYDTAPGKYDVKLSLATKPNLRIHVGGNISSTALNQAYLGLEYKIIGYTASSWNLDGYFSSFYSSAGFSGRVDFFAGGRPVYFEYGGLLSYYNYFKPNYGFLTKGNDITFSKYDDHYGKIAFGTPVSRSSVLSLRFHGGRDQYRYFQQEGYGADDIMDRTRFVFGGAQLEVDWKKTNYALYPTKGVHQTISVIGVRGIDYFRPGTAGIALREPSTGRRRTWYGAKFSREQYFRTPPLKWFS
ncbi:MAG: patatin-like phospholipase family protein [Alistipes sp.]|nr:patatin-like phospholipase family protein [Alistipes sp.]